MKDECAVPSVIIHLSYSLDSAISHQLFACYQNTLIFELVVLLLIMGVFQLLYFLVHAIQSLLVPICSAAAWTFTLLVVWSTWAVIRDTAKQAAGMHRIPCANCQFFTGDYHLKCTVLPSIAMSEAAINCPDYRARTNPFTASSINSLSKNESTDSKARFP